ncbi:MAG: PPOX class F420-dependent oxidoreductase [bacterium]
MALPDTVKEFLQKPNLAVLATISPKRRPQATPVWFLVDGDHIVVNTSRGRVKHHNVEKSPFVAVTVVDRDDPYRFVQIQGKVVKLDWDHGARDIDRLSQRYRGHKYQYPSTDAPDRRVSLIIKPLKVYAPRFV